MTEVLDFVQVRRISIEGQKYSKCTDNTRGLSGFEGRESVVGSLTCYRELVQVIGNINVQQL
jgi:hypothetical protein